MINRNNIFVIIFIVIFFGLPIISTFFQEFEYNPFDYAKITEVDSKVIVDNDDGKVTVTEKLKFDVHAAFKNNPFVELWRDLPEDYVDGLYVDYKVNSVKQILENGKEIIYEESPKLYWYDSDYESDSLYGPEHWYHSKGPYDEENRDYECLLFYVNEIYREEIVFEIEYEMSNVGLRYNDCSELYLAMYSGPSINHLKSFKGQILIEDNYMPDVGNYFSHTYGTNSADFNFSESQYTNPGYYTFEFELNESDLKFRPHNEYIEFSLVTFNEDKHIFTKDSVINNYSYDNVLTELIEEQEKYENKYELANLIKIILLVVSFFFVYLIVLYTKNKIQKIKCKFNLCNPTIQADYFREIPSDLDPQFVSTLVFCKDSEKIKEKAKDNVYSAILLSLVRKKYIELVRINGQLDWTSSNVKIIMKYETDIKPAKDILENTNLETTKEIIVEDLSGNLEPLSTSEKLYFDIINKYCKNKEISISYLQSKLRMDYQNTRRFVKNMEKSIIDIGISFGYFQDSNYEQIIKEGKSKSLSLCTLGVLIIILFNLISYHTLLDLSFGAFFLLGFALIGSGIYIRKHTRKNVLLTQFGEDEYVKWRGLYNFLNSETLMNERTVIELPIWEQYLVYATAFGISDKVSKALKVRCPEAVNSPIINNPYYCSPSFRYNSMSFNHTVRSSSSTSHFGGHGGYGGGGRGGGGGGGGH